MKYLYAFDENREVIEAFQCVKNKIYFANYDLSIKLVKAEGEQRQYLRLANNNFFADLGSSGESEEHFNAKMQIVKNKGYFDTILNQFLSFSKLIPEFKQGNKIPDISCYDENDNLVMCIEIFFSNKKSEDDIEQLKKLNVPITEINIKDENKCKHIVLTPLLEEDKRQYWIARSRNNEIKKEFSFFTKQQGGQFEILQNEYSYFEKEIEKEKSSRIRNIDKWLQKRIEKVSRTDRENKQIEINFQEQRNNILKLIQGIKSKNIWRKRILQIEREIVEIESLIEINSFYSNPETQDFFWINLKN